MLNRILFCTLAGIISVSCNNNKAPDQQSSTPDSSAAKSSPPEQSTLPSFVVFRNWEPGDPRNSELIVHTYNAWDSDSTGVMSTYFGDSTKFDLPDGRRFTTTNSSIESTLRKWRKNYKATSNIPFSLISLHNKDLDQQWVIAWTWNKWSNVDGTRDSMLYCDNWRLQNGKIVYLNSLQNRPSSPLLKRLNKITAN